MSLKVPCCIIADRKRKANTPDEWEILHFLDALAELPASGYEVKKTMSTEEAHNAPAVEFESYDAVFVVTRPERHLESIKNVVKKRESSFLRSSSVVHIFCNGPLGLTEEDVKACKDICDSERRVSIHVMWPKRYNSFVSAASKALTGGKIVDKDAGETHSLQFPYALLGDLNVILGIMEGQLPTNVQLCRTESVGSLMCIVEFQRGVRYRISCKDGEGPSYFKAPDIGAEKEEFEPLSKLLPKLLSSAQCEDQNAVFEAEMDTLRLSECARRSLSLDGSKVAIRPGAAPLKLVCIGKSFTAEFLSKTCGVLGGESTVCPACLCVPTLDESALQIPDVNGVFLSSKVPNVCDAAKTCLAMRKRLIMQTPVRPDVFDELSKSAERLDSLLMVDFFKRFDGKFGLAKGCLHDILGNQLTRKLETLRVEHAISVVLLEKIFGDAFTEPSLEYIRNAFSGNDGGAGTKGDKNKFIEEFMYGCLIHDIDLISWMFDGVHCEILVTDAEFELNCADKKEFLTFKIVFSVSVLTIKNSFIVTLDYIIMNSKEDARFTGVLEKGLPSSSTVVVSENGVNKNGDSGDDDSDDEEEEEDKDNDMTYRNTITINGEVFGHNSEHKAHYDVGKQFKSTYVNEFRAFSAHSANEPGQGLYARSYARTFSLAEKALKALETSTQSDVLKKYKPFISVDLSSSDDKKGEKDPRKSPEANVLSVSPETHVEFAKLWKESTKTAAEVKLILRNHVSRGEKQAEAASAANGDESVTVAGHGGIFKRDGMIFKSLAFNEDEWNVYSYLLENFTEILPFIPHIYGRKVINGYPFFAMEDLTKGYSSPAVLDLKLGEPGHFLNIHNEPFSMKVAGYSGTLQIAKSQQSWHDLVAYFRDYLREKESGNIRYDVIPEFVDQVEKMYALFSTQSKVKLRATSLLFVYESDESVIVPKKPQVKLIDFARAIIYEKRGRNLLATSMSPFSSFASPPSLASLSSPLFGSSVPPPLPLAGEGGDDYFAGSFDDFVAERKKKKKKGDASMKLANHPLYESANTIDHFFCNGLANLKKLLSSIFKKFVKRNSVFLCRDDITPDESDSGEKEASRANYISDILRNERVSVVISKPTEREARIGQLVATNLGIMHEQDPFLENLGVDEKDLGKLQEIMLPSLSEICAKHKRIAIIGKPKLFTEILSVLMGQPWEVSLESSNIIALVPCPSSPLGWNIERMTVNNSFFTSNDDLQYSQIN